MRERWKVCCQVVDVAAVEFEEVVLDLAEVEVDQGVVEAFDHSLRSGSCPVQVVLDWGSCLGQEVLGEGEADAGGSAGDDGEGLGHGGG